MNLNIIGVKKGHVMSSAIMAITGLIIGLLTMPAEATVLLKTLDGMAFPVLEVMNVFLIDFPMSILAAVLFTLINKGAKIKDGIICGFLFLLIIIFLIFSVGVSTGMAEPIADTAIKSSHLFGFAFPIFCLIFLLFDFGVCVLGGILGITIMREMKK